MRRKNTTVIGIVALCMMLSGCSLIPKALRSQYDAYREEAIKEIEEIVKEDDEKQEEAAQPEAEPEDASIGTLLPKALEYLDITYGDFLKRDGEEAEFLHGGRYIAKCPDLNAYAVFEGEWPEDNTPDFSIEEYSEFLRLEGDTQTFFTGRIDEMTADEFIKQLEENYTVTSEYRESGGTAYYVSASDYLHIELKAKDDSGVEAVVEIACEEGEKISPDSYCWILPMPREHNLFSEIPSDFMFSSGAGGWSTDIEISEDGSFTGMYHDSDMGDTGEGYPNGTLYICEFSGKFSIPEPTDNPYIYSMKLLELNVKDEEKIDTQEIVDETLYVYSTPYGFEDADEFLIYLPGAPMSAISEECRFWMFVSDAIFNELPDGFYVIYNVGGQYGFTSQESDTIWSRNFKYENGDAYITFWPSYYMGSYLSFFYDDNSPTALGLSVPWDGKSTSPMDCEKSWDDDGTLVRVTIKPDEGSTAELMKLVISVECITDPGFDFSAWGGNVPGMFSAVFTEEPYEGY